MPTVLFLFWIIENSLWVIIVVTNCSYKSHRCGPMRTYESKDRRGRISFENKDRCLNTASCRFIINFIFICFGAVAEAIWYVTTRMFNSDGIFWLLSSWHTWTKSLNWMSVAFWIRWWHMICYQVTHLDNITRLNDPGAWAVRGLLQFWHHPTCELWRVAFPIGTSGSIVLNPFDLHFTSSTLSKLLSCSDWLSDDICYILWFYSWHVSCKMLCQKWRNKTEKSKYVILLHGKFCRI